MVRANIALWLLPYCMVLSVQSTSCLLYITSLYNFVILQDSHIVFIRPGGFPIMLNGTDVLKKHVCLSLNEFKSSEKTLSVAADLPAEVSEV